MTVSDFAAKLRLLRSQIEREAADIGAGIGHDVAALVADRVVQRGQTEDGGSFSPYSTKPAPAFFFRGKSRRSSADSAVARLQKARTPLSYAAFRELNGLKSDKKNFEFTGEMWRGLGVTAVGFDGRTIRVTIGGKTASSGQKIGWLSEQEGRNIIEPSAAELARAARSASQRIQRTIDQALL